MKKFALPIIILGILLWTASAGAGIISMQVAASARYGESGLRVEVQVRNGGDEAASNVRVTARTGETEKQSPLKTTVGAGETFTSRMLLEPRLDRPGVYPVEVRVDFQDGNGHPFSALSSALFSVGEPLTPLVVAEKGEMVLRGRGKLPVSLVNSDQSDHRVTVRAIAPREFNLDETRRDVTVPARGRTETGFSLSNFSAREGARYPVLVFAEYDFEDRHFASATPMMILVGPPVAFFQAYRNWLIAGAAALFLFVALAQVVRRRRDSGRRRAA